MVSAVRRLNSILQVVAQLCLFPSVLNGLLTAIYYLLIQADVDTHYK